MSNTTDQQCSTGALAPHKLRGDQLRRTMWRITAGWFFGSIWLNSTAGTPITQYAKALGASNFQFGVLAALPFVASLFTLPGTLLIEATGRRKLIFLIFLYFQRLMWIPLALVPYWIVRHDPSQQGLAVVIYLILLFLMYTGNAIGGPGWIGWMSDIIPPKMRGTYFSRRRQWGLVTAIPAAWGAGWFLDHYAQGQGQMTVLNCCAGVYLVACFFGLLDIFYFHFVPDIATPPKKGSDLLRAWGEPLRNGNFLCFAGFVGTLMFAVSFMGQFLTLYMLQQLGADAKGNGTAGLNQITQLMLIVAPSAAQLLVLPIWGKAADRMGKRPVLMLAALGMVPVAFGWCFVTRETIWLGYLMSALGGVLWAGVDIANFNILLEFSGSSGKGIRGGTAYIGVNSVIVNLAGCAGGFASGALAESLKDFYRVLPVFGELNFFHVLFILSGILRFVSVFAFLRYLHEPSARPTVDVLRYVSSNIYSNMYSAAMQPLRLISIRPGKSDPSE